MVNRTLLGAMLRGQDWTSKMPSLYDEWKLQTGKGLACYASFAALSPQLSVPSPIYGQTLDLRLNEVRPLLDQGYYTFACITWMTTEDTSKIGPASSAPVITHEVAAGVHDEVIRAYARWVKANFPYRLLLRINHEFDMPSNMGWGVNKTDYVGAFRRIVDIFRSEAVPNVEFVWSPNFGSEAGVLFADYYPGDDYVDWVGISVYSNTWGWVDFESMFKARGWENQNPLCPYDFAMSKGKRFMVGEWALNIDNDMTDDQNVPWMENFFDAIERRKVDLICHWGGTLTTASWLYLLNYLKCTEVYRRRVSSPLYSDKELPTPTPLLATLTGAGLGAAIGYASNRKKPLVPMVVGAVAGGTVGFIIERLRS